MAVLWLTDVASLMTSQFPTFLGLVMDSVGFVNTMKQFTQQGCFEIQSIPKKDARSVRIPVTRPMLQKGFRRGVQSGLCDRALSNGTTTGQGGFDRLFDTAGGKI